MIENTLGTFGSHWKVDADDGFAAADALPAGGIATGPSFADSLRGALDSVNSLQNNAQHAATAFALGQVSDIHSVMIAAQKASIALNLTTEVRNKVVDAYQSIMQTTM